MIAALLKESQNDTNLQTIEHIPQVTDQIDDILRALDGCTDDVDKNPE